jgi:hypothetical protein
MRVRSVVGFAKKCTISTKTNEFLFIFVNKSFCLEIIIIIENAHMARTTTTQTLVTIKHYFTVL